MKILSFVGDIVSVATIQDCLSVNTARDNMEMNWCWYIPISFICELKL